MTYLSNRSSRREQFTWPGFVDALATLLMVVIFVLMIFSVAQFYLNQIVSGQDEALSDLNKQISEVYKLLQFEKGENEKLSFEISTIKIELNNAYNDLNKSLKNNDALSETIKSLRNNILEMSNEKKDLSDKLIKLSKESSLSKDKYDEVVLILQKKIDLSRDKIAVQIDDILKLEKMRDKLKIEIVELIEKDKEINANILKERDYSKTLEEKIISLKDKSILSQKEAEKSSAEIIKFKAEVKNLKTALTQMNLKLSQLQALFDKQKEEDEAQKVEIKSFGESLNNALASRVQELQKFRSEFFGRLSELLENREEIQIVGDRFVFQSEVLFAPGSAAIGLEGENQLEKLSLTLKEIAASIPDDINWVLQVEGHTDITPLSGGQYLDNWDLSTERSLSVVRYLIKQGVNPNRLSASGYGEFQPLKSNQTNITENSDEDLRRNRRIELKITQRIE